MNRRVALYARHPGAAAAELSGQLACFRCPLAALKAATPPFRMVMRYCERHDHQKQIPE